MRILIVEDEEATRRGITGILQRFTEDVVVGCAANGQEGIAAVQELSPDLVITDVRMPILSGIQMLEALDEKGLAVNAIILSGYSDFEYARSAIHLGVTEYLLKPLEIEKFLSALERSRKKLAITQQSIALPETVLGDYIKQPEKRTEEKRLILQELLHISQGTELGCFVVAPEISFQGMLATVKHCVSERMESFCFERTYDVPLEERWMLSVIIGVENDTRLRDKLEVKVVPELRNIAPCRCVYFTCHDIEEMALRISTLQQQLEQCFYESLDKCVDLRNATQDSFTMCEYPSEEENRVLAAYRGGRREEAEHWGTVLLERLCTKKVDPKIVKEYSAIFLAVLYRSIRNIDGGVNPSGTDGDITTLQTTHTYTNIMNAENVDTLREYYMQLLHWMLERKNIKDAENTDNGIILNAIAYIRSHFSEDVSLTDVAQACGVSQAYLSRLFVSEMGVNFNPFLQTYRVSVAKKFLKRGDVTVAAVSEQVGFRDQKYFNKVFKKLCGMTPREYQKECRG